MESGQKEWTVTAAKYLLQRHMKYEGIRKQGAYFGSLWINRKTASVSKNPFTGIPVNTDTLQGATEKDKFNRVDKTNRILSELRFLY